MTEHSCGSIHRVPVGAIADKAARFVLAYATPRALALAPDGQVFVEPVHSAAEADVVGVYTASAGLLALSRQLIEDLRFEIAARQLRPIRRRRVIGAAIKQARGLT